MKAIKPLVLLAFSVFISGCFDSPDFDDTPRIEYERICFGEASVPTKQDSLLVQLTFEDGDGDLGLGEQDRNEPFHEYDLFLHNGTAVTTAVRNVYGSENAQNAFLDVPDGINGKLVRPGDIADLPPDDCNNFKFVDILVAPTDINIVDETYDEGLYDIDTISSGSLYYRVTGRFLYEDNRFNKNIFVRFFRNQTPDNPNGFQEYFWPSCQNFDGRFERLSDETAPLSGKITYTMKSFGIRSVMGNPAETWRLEFTVLDRARRESNTVSTQPFTLAEITRACL